MLTVSTLSSSEQKQKSLPIETEELIISERVLSLMDIVCTKVYELTAVNRKNLKKNQNLKRCKVLTEKRNM